LRAAVAWKRRGKCSMSQASGPKRIYLSKVAISYA
jgi:hypothetical protein